MFMGKSQIKTINIQVFNFFNVGTSQRWSFFLFPSFYTICISYDTGFFHILNKPPSSFLVPTWDCIQSAGLPLDLRAGQSCSCSLLGNLVLGLCWAILFTLDNLVHAGQSCRRGRTYKALTIMITKLRLLVEWMNHPSIATDLPLAENWGLWFYVVVCSAWSF